MQVILLERVDKLGQMGDVVDVKQGYARHYGSVSTRDAAAVATEEGYSVDRKQVLIRQPIKELGLHEVEMHLHPEVMATVTLNVARSPEEAELQASGKTMQEAAAEEEEVAEFEIAVLFDDIGSAVSEDEELAEAIEDSDSEPETFSDTESESTEDEEDDK